MRPARVSFAHTDKGVVCDRCCHKAGICLSDASVEVWDWHGSYGWVEHPGNCIYCNARPVCTVYRWPSIEQLAASLRVMNERSCRDQRVVLRIGLPYERAEPSMIYCLSTGTMRDMTSLAQSVCYDAASSLPGNGARFNAREVASDLLAQAREQAAGGSS